MRKVEQSAKKTFANCRNLNLKGFETCILEFDDHNDSVIADRIYLKKTGRLLYGQLELPLNLQTV